MVLPHPHSFTGYILRFSRASYGLILSPLLGYLLSASYCLISLLHRISFKVFPCFLWSYLISTPSPDIRLRFLVLLMVLSHPHSFTGYLLRFSRASYGLTSPPLLHRISFNVFLVLLMVLPHLHSFTGYILRFSRASYGLISSPLLHRISFKVSPLSYGLISPPFLYRISFNVSSCFLWSYLIPTPSPDIF